MISTSPTSTAPIGAGGWYTTGQVAKRLGYDRRRIWELCVQGTIPAHRLPGGSWRIPREWVQQQLDQARSKVIRRKPEG